MSVEPTQNMAVFTCLLHLAFMSAQSDTDFTVLRSNSLVTLGELSNVRHHLYGSC